MGQLKVRAVRKASLSSFLIQFVFQVCLLEFRGMGIAIRKDAAQTSLKKLVDKYMDEGRTCLKVTCPASNCGQEYTIYYSPAFAEAEVRKGFEPYLNRDHPNHPVIYEINESKPEDAN
jgi:hypothetical protein